jgi:hypothetical protein
VDRHQPKSHASSAIKSQNKSTVDFGGGGGGAGVVDLDAPCGPESSAYTTVDGITLNARTAARQRPDTILLSFFIACSPLLVNCRDTAAAWFRACAHLSKNSLTKSIVAYVL